MESKIVTRIRKLLELSKRNDSPEEAAQAAGLAQEMMFKYQIGEMDIEATETVRKEEELVNESIHKEKRRAVWRSSLAFSIAQGFGCEMYVDSTKEERTHFQIYGTVSAVQTVSYMFNYLNLEINRLCESEWEAHGKESKQQCKTWKNSFRLGAVNEVRKRLLEQRKTQKAAVNNAVESTALALYKSDEQRVVEGYKAFSKRLRFRNASSAPTRHNQSAYSRGANAGSAIGLSGGKAIAASKERIE